MTFLDTPFIYALPTGLTQTTTAQGNSFLEHFSPKWSFFITGPALCAWVARAPFAFNAEDALSPDGWVFVPHASL